MSEEVTEMPTSSIIYAEYVRLSTALEELTNSSFDDFKLFAVIGAILGLKPLADSLSGGEVSAAYLFVGFLGLFFIIAIIAFRDTLKQSLIFYISTHLIRYEKVIRQQVPIAIQEDLFQTYGEVDVWFRKRHKNLVLAFNFFFLLPVIIIPSFVLWRGKPSGPYFSLTYIAVCFAVYAFYFFMSKVYLSRPVGLHNPSGKA